MGLSFKIVRHYCLFGLLQYLKDFLIRGVIPDIEKEIDRLGLRYGTHDPLKQERLSQLARLYLKVRLPQDLVEIEPLLLEPVYMFGQLSCNQVAELIVRISEVKQDSAFFPLDESSISFLNVELHDGLYPIHPLALVLRDLNKLVPLVLALELRVEPILVSILCGEAQVSGLTAEPSVHLFLSVRADYEDRVLLVPSQLVEYVENILGRFRVRVDAPRKCALLVYNNETVSAFLVYPEYSLHHVLIDVNKVFVAPYQALSQLVVLDHVVGSTHVV